MGNVSRGIVAAALLFGALQGDETKAAAWEQEAAEGDQYAAMAVCGEAVFLACRGALSSHAVMDGRLLWLQTSARGEAEEKPGGLPGNIYSGVWAGPSGVFAGGYWHKDRAEAGWLGRYDPKTGKPVWERGGGDLPGAVGTVKGWEAGKAVIAGGFEMASSLKKGKQHIGMTGDGWLGCYAAADGKTLWEHKFAGERRAAVYAICVDSEGKRLFAGGTRWSDKERWQSWLGCFEPATGKPVWERKAGELPGRISALRLSGDRLVATGDGAKNPCAWLGCYEAASGKTLWERKPDDLPILSGGMRCDALIQTIQDKVLIGGNDLKDHAWIGCYALKDGEKRWEKTVEGRHLHTLSLDEKRILAVGADAAKEAWLGFYEADTGKTVREKTAIGPASVVCVASSGAEPLRAFVWSGKKLFCIPLQ